MSVVRVRTDVLSTDVARLVSTRRVWLCDLDGTLVDSSPVHEAAFREALAEIAPELLTSFSYGDHAGAGTREVVTTLGAAPADAERLIRRKQELYRERVEAGMVTLLPGARQLLERLTRTGRTLYLVTSGSRESVRRVLSAGALTGCFRAVLTSDEVACAKPDPRFYLHACRLWSLDPADCLVLEDSAHGVASALGAGLVTLQVHAALPAQGALPVRHLDQLIHLIDAETDDRE
ncbi:Sugar phosphatase YfbT [Nonomuraea coxensis DSM 45129]|uniref:Sugar phosphatase YfbT n=1 Tax=Nonomuraea coxensis DSM 45129 TaxID=1122611 RepID=A0ABX8TXV4_9ACTN|nr:HAD family phosphatase [Nonomuraea coxensis]QYC40335.1 Sugar phosphatase YfbT [Nonomuraea coxensis DSM 45129]